MLPQAVFLWAGPELVLALSERAMARYPRLKYRVYVEDGMPEYDTASSIRPCHTSAGIRYLARSPRRSAGKTAVRPCKARTAS
jgi:hypothetical protein